MLPRLRRPVSDAPIPPKVGFKLRILAADGRAISTLEYTFAVTGLRKKKKNKINTADKSYFYEERKEPRIYYNDVPFKKPKDII